MILTDEMIDRRLKEHNAWRERGNTRIMREIFQFAWRLNDRPRSSDADAQRKLGKVER